MSSEDGGGRGPGSPTLCFAFGKASCDGAVIPAVNKPFPGLLMGTIWQRGASGPLQSRSCFPMPETHQLLGSPSASTGLEPTGNGLDQHWAQPWWPLWRGEGRERLLHPSWLLANVTIQRQVEIGGLP